MVAELAERELITPPEQDVPGIQQLQRFLSTRPLGTATLVAPDGQRLPIPASIYHVLRQIVPLMARGETIGLVPLHKELTTQDAADLLNMSRPSLIKILDAGQIPYSRPGQRGHRRVRFVDVMQYKQQRDAARRTALVEMAAIGQEYGAYDTDNPDALFGIEVDETNDERD